MHEDDPRWLAVQTRDARADGAFVYSVASTGIYCRPTCPSRRPTLRNVAFHVTCDAAEQAGFRACKRCNPRGPQQATIHAARITHACRALEQDPPPDLATLADMAGLSTFHFHRLFREATGLTPRQYAEAHREQRARDALASGMRVTDAIYDAGYAAPRRFYERAETMLGMAPRAYLKGGAKTAIAFITEQTSLGLVLVARTDNGVCAILFGDTTSALQDDIARRFPNAEIAPATTAVAGQLRAVIAAVDTPRPGALPLPLDLAGTAFQQRVWQALRNVPAGKTVSYADLAEGIGAPRAMRAVAAACAANPAAIAVPCHRVVRSDGSLSGYRWGVERKAALLKREGGH